MTNRSSKAIPWIFQHVVKPVHLRLREAVSRLVDRRLGIVTTDEVVARLLGVDIGHFRRTQRALSWRGARKVVRGLHMGPDDVLLDIGCGAGRIACLAARLPIRRVIGIDLDPRMTALAGTNAARLRRRRCPIEVVEADATAWDVPGDVTCVYMYNPVRGELLEAALGRVLDSVDQRARRLRLAYANPTEHELVMSLRRFRPTTRLAISWRPGGEWARTQAIQFYEVAPAS